MRLSSWMLLLTVIVALSSAITSKPVTQSDVLAVLGVIFLVHTKDQWSKQLRGWVAYDENAFYSI